MAFPGEFVCVGCGCDFVPSEFVSHEVSGVECLGCGSDVLKVWLCCCRCWEAGGEDLRQRVAKSVESRFRLLVEPVRLTYGPSGVVEFAADRVRYDRQMEAVAKVRESCLSALR